MTIRCPKCHFDNPADSKFCKECGTNISPAVTQTVESPKEELTTGHTFAGRYQIIEELGRGGMGQVYRVLDKKLKEEIALKLIRPEIAMDRKTIERFSNELKIARKIGHKNVARMFDLNEEKGTHYITMEFIRGEDLKGLIRKMGQLSAGQAITIAKQVCDGLDEAHRLGVVHRDLKPQNVMIDTEGNARILDFGIARSHEAKGITGAGVMIGTPEYMSPEQVEGMEVDQRSDIYSLGVILYEIVTGRVPFEGDTPFTIGVKHKSEIPTNPKELNTQIPEDFNRVILRCLEKDKENRYQSAGELRAELESIEKGIPTTEKIVPKRRPITSKEITVKFSLQKLVIPAVIVLVAAIAALVLFRGGGFKVNPNLVVVAIFENQTGDESLDPLGRMAADWITQGISQTGAIDVVPTMAVMESSRIVNAEAGVPRGPEELRALAKETGAGTLVSGVYYLADEELQFHASITDVQTRKLIHSFEPIKGSLDAKMESIQSLRQKIMNTLAMYFETNYGESALKLRNPPAYEAYKEFLLGTECFSVDYPRAIQHFEHASELDPSFIMPKIFIAFAYDNQGRKAEADSIVRFLNKNREQLSAFDRHFLDFYEADLEGNYAEALRYVIQAEKLAPKNQLISYLHGLYALIINQPEETVKTYAKMDSIDLDILYLRPVWSARIDVLAEALHMLGNYKKELKEIRKGQKYYPNSLRLRANETRALAALGRIDEVKKVIEESSTIVSSGETLGDVMFEAALTLRAHGHLEAYQETAQRAVEWCRSRIYEKEATENQRYDLARALYTAEKWDEALVLFEKLAAENPDNIGYKGFLGVLAARRDDREAALEISEELKDIERPYIHGEHTYWRACIASLLGKKQQAVTLLAEAFSQGHGYRASLHNDMNLEPLRDYPPFKELMRPKG